MQKPNVIQRAFQRVAIIPVVTNFISGFLHNIDAPLMRATRGHFSLARYVVGFPMILITMKGAKSGQLRTLPLMGAPDQNGFGLIGTNFGREHHPAWYYNLTKYPECKVLYKGKTQTYIARELRGEEYDRMWELARSIYIGYDLYKANAGRPIHILFLEPKTPTP
jgi:deazaflavin-dependent oxidoreductase (nitroreductase family)